MSLPRECEPFLSPPFSFQVSVRACLLRHIAYHISRQCERRLTSLELSCMETHGSEFQPVSLKATLQERRFDRDLRLGLGIIIVTMIPRNERNPYSGACR